MNWTDEKLAELPGSAGFRLRGLEMTRLETFTDAAFAFATTLLVISTTGIPGSFDELLQALKGTPAFAASFASIAILWFGHRRWSRRYGLEDRLTILITLSMIFVMLVYVYPLKMIFTGFFYWVSGGWRPSSFTISGADELAGLFVVYGLGFFATSGCLCLLYVRASSLAVPMALNRQERLRTREEIVAMAIMAATGLVSALMALAALSMPVVAMRYDGKVERAG
jgi:uncharacterized membrane protein